MGSEEGTAWRFDAAGESYPCAPAAKPLRAVPKSEWEWFGQAGHHICSDRCRFHLHTHVGGFCVSTVGESYVDHRDDEPDEVGADRLYETMVFRLRDGESDYCNPLVAKPYNDRDAANAGHLAACEEYALKGNIE